jgi:hypothetical protein
MRRALPIATFAVIAVASTAAAVQASPIIFDNVSRADFTSGRPAGNSPLAAITVSSSIDIDQIGVHTDLDANGSLKFVIFNLGTDALLFATPAQAFVDNGLTYKLSNPFASFTLLPGITYGIGAVADVGGLWSTNNVSAGNPFTQNGITASDDLNGNVVNFASPGMGSDGTAMIIVQLAGGSAAVPEPATMALLGGGLLAGVSRRLRRRA